MGESLFMDIARRILVTSALPYANGSIHIGHLVEYIQTDIWVRFQKLRGNEVTYVCGDDAHGTPIMLKAREAGVTPEEWIAKYHAEHKADFAKFGVGFDNFYTTHSDINRELSYVIYDRVKAGGHIGVREIEQLYDPKENVFLPDRFIRGTCPNCKSPDQYGDSCEVCGKTFDPTDLINPQSVISGATPVMKKSRHLFLNLEKSRDFLLKLYDSGFVDPSIKNKLLEWFSGALRDWDISRDAPFFGFPIPGEDKKFFYNWFDAPIGYLASLGNLQGVDAKGVEEFWGGEDLERYHFIGKDIQYFHAMFWPAMLHAANFAVPTKLCIHGFLTVNGKKMSKRDGTFISANVFAKHCDPQWLRYYFATKLGPGPEDLDLSFDDFANRVNSELVGKLANLVSRCAPILTKNLEGQLGVPANDAVPIIHEARNAADEIAEAYEAREFAAVTRRICAVADRANKYLEENAPWKLVKTDAEAARGVLTAALEVARILTIYLKPILPDYAKKVETCLAVSPQRWENVQDAMHPHAILPFEHLVQRVDLKQVQAMIEESKPAVKPEEKKPEAPVAAAAAAPAAAAGPAEPLAPTINFDQFLTVDLRLGKVVTAEVVAGSNKLLKIQLDAGEIGQRTIYAGIQKAYRPEQLVGRLVAFVANLAPRTMKINGNAVVSEGMIIASGPGGSEVFVMSPDAGAKPGQRLH